MYNLIGQSGSEQLGTNSSAVTRNETWYRCVTEGDAAYGIYAHNLGRQS
jgi:hypothetical protein